MISLFLAALLLAPSLATAAGGNARGTSRPSGAAAGTGSAVAPVSLNVAPLSLGAPAGVSFAVPTLAAPAAAVSLNAPQLIAGMPAPLNAAPLAQAAPAGALPLPGAARMPQGPAQTAPQGPVQAAQNAPARLIDTLAAPMAEDSGGASAESASASEADFMARAQLGGRPLEGAPAATLAAASASPAPSGLAPYVRGARTAAPKGQVHSFAGVDHSGEVLRAALTRLVASPVQSVVLDFTPGAQSLRALLESPSPAALTRSGGVWTLSKGGVSAAPAAELTVVNRPALTPADLVESAGRGGRFLAAVPAGLVEWSPRPAERGASQFTAWPRVTDEALAAGEARFSPATRGLAAVRSFTGAGRALGADMRAQALAVQTAAARERGLEAVLSEFESGALAESAPELNARLESVGEDAMRAALSGMQFEAMFLYGGVTGTHIYTSPQLPGLILKVYKRPLDLLNLPSSASSGYALAKAKLGGLFAKTSIVRDIEVRVGGGRRLYRRAIIQEKAETKNVRDWATRAQATMDAMELRGVRDTDTGPRRGIYDAHLARNLGEASDGSLVHFDADWFKPIRGGTERPIRVADPEPLRSVSRRAQSEALAALWAATR